MATVQLVIGGALLALAGWFYVLNHTKPHNHVAGPGLIAAVVAVPGVGLVVSGLALGFRWPGWQMLQLAPWFAVALTIAWLRGLP